MVHFKRERERSDPSCNRTKVIGAVGMRVCFDSPGRGVVPRSGQMRALYPQLCSDNVTIGHGDMTTRLYNGL